MRKTDAGIWSTRINRSFLGVIMKSSLRYQRGFWGAALANGGWLSSLAAGVMSLVGGERRNRAQRAAATRQMRFQEHMSSTAYQRATADLEQAGLNRILALGNPASSPQGAMPEIHDTLTPAISSARDVGVAHANIEKTQADTVLIKYRKEYEEFKHDMFRKINEGLDQLGEYMESGGYDRMFGAMDDAMETISSTAKMIQGQSEKLLTEIYNQLEYFKKRLNQPDKLDTDEAKDMINYMYNFFPNLWQDMKDHRNSLNNGVQ